MWLTAQSIFFPYLKPDWSPLSFEPSFPFKCVNCHTSSKLPGPEGHFSPPLPCQLSAESLTPSCYINALSWAMGKLPEELSSPENSGVLSGNSGTFNDDPQLPGSSPYLVPGHSHTGSDSMFSACSQATTFPCQSVKPDTRDLHSHLCRIALLSQ